MKRIKLCTHDMSVNIDANDVMFLDASQWFKIGMDEHADYVSYDDGTGQGEIQWCPNAITGRMPVNDKFTKAGGWSPYFDQATLDRAVSMHAQRKAQVEAEAAAVAAANASVKVSGQ